MGRVTAVTTIIKRTVSHIFTKPATAKYPFAKSTLSENFRGQPQYNIDYCNVISLGNPNFGFDVQKIAGSACRVCARDCPVGAITIVEVDGKRRPQFDFNKCIFCNQCVESCPRKAIVNSDAFELAVVDKKALVRKPKPNSGNEKQ
ncbi:MAG: 4Fe-4S binding protein [Candidatus Bathyarchaeota archaeon]|nr:4Fe-4S binding protein [Candidatus Termiticorpusculum sp.]